MMFTILLFYARQSEEMRAWLEAREDGVEEFSDDIFVSLYRNENGNKIYAVVFPTRYMNVRPLTDIVRIQETLCDEFHWTPEAAFTFAHASIGQVIEITFLESLLRFWYVQDINAHYHELKCMEGNLS